MKILDYEISTTYPSLPIHGKLVVNTLNPHSYCVAKKDSVFQLALKDSDVLLPDGVGIVMAARFLNGKKIEKKPGYDLHVHCLQMLQNSGGGKVFYLGASLNTLRLIEDRIKVEFPLLKVEFYSPPFKSEFSDEDSFSMISAINGFKPDVLFVGMTAPKQEKWVHCNKTEIDTKMICSIGAVFDFYAGTIKRPSGFWISIGLEWLPRFLKEPRRLWRRNLISTPEFIIDVIKFKFFR
jgi:N-acetylglucosaminyldiphosphoundecaprenol N-acetyl-beta-D-mannosaminyltransferase